MKSIARILPACTLGSVLAAAGFAAGCSETPSGPAAGAENAMADARVRADGRWLEAQREEVRRLAAATAWALASPGRRPPPRGDRRVGGPRDLVREPSGNCPGTFEERVSRTLPGPRRFPELGSTAVHRRHTVMGSAATTITHGARIPVAHAARSAEAMLASCAEPAAGGGPPAVPVGLPPARPLPRPHLEGAASTGRGGDPCTSALACCSSFSQPWQGEEDWRRSFGDALLASVYAELADASTPLREAMDAARDAGFVVRVGTFKELRQFNASRTPSLRIFVDPVWAGVTVYGLQPDSTVQQALVAVDLDGIRARLTAARVRDAVRDVLVHELWGHLVPVAAAGHIRARVFDPSPGEDYRSTAIGRRENEMRRSMGLPVRRYYGLLGE